MKRMNRPWFKPALARVVQDITALKQGAVVALPSARLNGAAELDALHNRRDFYDIASRQPVR